MTCVMCCVRQRGELRGGGGGGGGGGVPLSCKEGEAVYPVTLDT